MPISGLLSAAALGGVGQSIWQYNREKLSASIQQKQAGASTYAVCLAFSSFHLRNYMFDVPLRQAREFQVQNVNLARLLAKHRMCRTSLVVCYGNLSFVFGECFECYGRGACSAIFFFSLSLSLLLLPFGVFETKASHCSEKTSVTLVP